MLRDCVHPEHNVGPLWFCQFVLQFVGLVEVGGLGNSGFMVELDDIKGLLQPKWCYESFT